MTSRTFALGFALFGSTALAAVACGNGDDPNNGTGGAAGTGGTGGGSQAASECRVLGELCHRVDDMDGPLNECHEVGHSGDPVACAAEFDECTTSCVEAAEPGAGGAGGAASDPGPIKCVALGALCHPVDDMNGPLNECHELGHSADAAVCEADFDHGVESCMVAIAAAEGAGGAGGADSAGGAGGSPG